MANIVDVPRDLLPSPFRSLAHVVAGLELAAVLALALALLGVPVKAWLLWFAPWHWIPHEWSAVAVVATGTLVTLAVAGAYVLGLLADYWATEVWGWVGRVRGGDEDDRSRDDQANRTERARSAVGKHVLKRPQAIRTDYYLVEQAKNRAQFRDEAPAGFGPWLRAQRAIWTSNRAAAQFADLQMRLMLTKVTAVNAGFLWLVATVGLFAVEWRTGLVVLVVTLLVIAGGTMVFVNPDRIGDSTGLAPRRRRWVGWMVIAVGAMVYLTGWQQNLFNLAAPHWPETALPILSLVGAVLGFGFAFARVHTNALYHRAVHDATFTELPGEGD